MEDCGLYGSLTLEKVIQCKNQLVQKWNSKINHLGRQVKFKDSWFEVESFSQFSKVQIIKNQKIVIKDNLVEAYFVVVIQKVILSFVCLFVWSSKAFLAPSASGAKRRPATPRQEVAGSNAVWTEVVTRKSQTETNKQKKSTKTVCRVSWISEQLNLPPSSFQIRNEWSFQERGNLAIKYWLWKTWPACPGALFLP